MTAPTLSHATLQALLKSARRHSRLASEAEDIVQDILLATLVAGRNCGEPGFLAWANGAIRNRAAYMARTAVRRRAREGRYEFERGLGDGKQRRLPASFVSTLPKAQQVVAYLVNQGLDRREIAYILGLSETTLRQRISGLRRALAISEARGETDDVPPLPAGNGIQRRLLKESLPRLDVRRFAVRDPDGLPLFFSERAHISRPRGNMESNTNGAAP